MEHGRMLRYGDKVDFPAVCAIAGLWASPVPYSKNRRLKRRFGLGLRPCLLAEHVGILRKELGASPAAASGEHPVCDLQL